jgi:hypothetical protein
MKRTFAPEGKLGKRDEGTFAFNCGFGRDFKGGFRDRFRAAPSSYIRPSLAARSSQGFFVLSNFARSNTDHRESRATEAGKAVS